MAPRTLELKEFQQRALEALRAYLRACVQFGKADLAFYDVTSQVFGQGIPYRPVKELPGLPYACLRIPTGGGKTLVACHTVSLAAKELLHSERSLTLWLTPSNAIREQTLKALKDRSHPYRQAVEAGNGPVTVLDVGEALYLQPGTLSSGSTIIVATLQAFRVDDTEGRKVYEDAGALMSHFSGLPDEIKAKLERYENGTPVRSLANVLRLHRPVVIVDEAHNARTPLSFETLARFDPACILEFTATPDTKENPSNVLYSASAAELKAEEMIKLPIRLETRGQWRELLADAITRREALEEAAKKEQETTGEYIRPIMLLQAQPRYQDHETITVEVVEQTLLNDYKIPKEQVARATGEDRGLEGIDLLDPACKIRYVITVQALKEGWDCPFAYVLCSVAELRSSTAVEQILGRVLRMPRARRKGQAELNLAYAFSASKNFADTANELADALVQNGFERQEARDLIQASTPRQTDLPLFANRPPAEESVSLPVPEAAKINKLPAETAAKIKYSASERKLTFRQALDEKELEAVMACFSAAENQQAVEKANLRLRQVAEGSPAERGEAFSIPKLSIQQGDFFDEFDDTYFLEADWDLSKCGAGLSEAEYATEQPQGQEGLIDISSAGQVQTRFLSDLQRQMRLLSTDIGWTAADLAYWLDRNIQHPDITPEESGVFLIRLVQKLVDERGLSTGDLAQDKYRLKRAAEEKIGVYRKAAHREAYRQLLLPDCPTPVAVTPEACFTYDPNSYPYSRLYKGGYQFLKHYYTQIGDLEERGEEFECAQFIDTLPEVKYWARNLERRPGHSFWLQTSTDRFYPDFVCLLKDGRFLVVESKGAHLWDNEDSKEKRAIGELWEKRSQGRCLFVMPRGADWEGIRAKIQRGR